MEKLSSIIPANARVKSVDLTDVNPRRPGSPSFGMPVGTTSSHKDRVTINGPKAEDEVTTYRNPKDMKSAKMIQEITRNFFDNRLAKSPTTAAASPGAEQPVAEPVETINPAVAEELSQHASEAVTGELGDSLINKVPIAPMNPGFSPRMAVES